MLVASEESSYKELEERIAKLTRRVEILEKRLGASKTGTPAQPKTAAARTNVQQEVRQLYAKVDELVANGEIETARNTLNGFNEKYAGTPDIKWVGSLNREFQVIGKPAPESWNIEKWYQGESDVALDGQKTTLVIFWEVWCPHCRKEVPKMQALFEGYRDKGLQVLGLTRITRTATEEAVTGFIEEYGVGYPIAKETGEISEHFSVKGIPAAAVVKAGKIVWRGHPMRLTDEMLRKCL
jgi:peroxiredoxin